LRKLFICYEGIKISPFGDSSLIKVGINEKYIYEIAGDRIDNR
jgi:hypothetical protein